MQKPIRRSQLISPFGIGSMVNFPRDESLMLAGIDAWPHSKEECPPDSGWLIREERLERRLGVTHLRMPPDYRKPEGGAKYAGQSVPFVRFPRWHYCHFCGGMELLSPFSPVLQRCSGREYSQQSCAEKNPRKRPFLIPVRFVAVCDLGHIQDFPFMEWLHHEQKQKPDCRLRLRAGRSSAGLSGIRIECTCGAKKSFGDVFRFDENKGGILTRVGCFCKGLRPWLGEMERGAIDCGHHLRVLQRGASNVYFPNIISSIYLPLWAENISPEIIAVLEHGNYWATLSQRTVNGRIDQDSCRLIAEITNTDPVQLERAAQLKLENRLLQDQADIGGDEESFRRSEYKAICEGKVGIQTDLYVENVNNEKYGEKISKYFSRIMLVHKLRETRAFSGFTRILPPDGNVESPRMQSLKIDQRINWLPAIKVYGEGIFLELNLMEIEKWLSGNRDVLNRVTPLINNYNENRLERQQAHRKISVKFILIHSLAHVLINQLSFNCGYGSAALRERLYCDFNEPDNPMQGILIYTASGDSEGTMGGLVRQGKPGRLEPTILQALNHAAWCSSDPVCIESKGQGPDTANLAACHGCCLLPETSCEEGNRLLDRAMLIGIPNIPNLGFFNGWIG